MFGPIIIMWFVTIGVLGLVQIAGAPCGAPALNPLHAVRFFATNGWPAFVTLSAVFLAVTGGEALYADMGHFGRAPISRAWFRLVLPALTLNYFGQGALLLSDPAAIQNPFYLLAPSWLLAPLVVLATAATIIASQAVISGVFSVASQALNLGYLPRMRILQSSADGNRADLRPVGELDVAAGTALLVVGFGSSEALAGAYGIAVSATMSLAGIMIFVLGYIRRTERRFARSTLFGGICVVDLAFFCANSLRVFEGGWIPLVMDCRLHGDGDMARRATAVELDRSAPAVLDGRLHQGLERDPPNRVPGTAVYLTGEASIIPRPLIQQVGSSAACTSDRSSSRSCAAKCRG